MFDLQSLVSLLIEVLPVREYQKINELKCAYYLKQDNITQDVLLASFMDHSNA